MVEGKFDNKVLIYKLTGAHFLSDKIRMLWLRGVKDRQRDTFELATAKLHARITHTRDYPRGAGSPCKVQHICMNTMRLLWNIFNIIEWA